MAIAYTKRDAFIIHFNIFVRLFANTIGKGCIIALYHTKHVGFRDVFKN